MSPKITELLPAELWMNILKFFSDCKSFRSFSVVCRKFNAIITDYFNSTAPTSKQFEMLLNKIDLHWTIKHLIDIDRGLGAIAEKVYGHIPTTRKIAELELQLSLDKLKGKSATANYLQTQKEYYRKYHYPEPIFNKIITAASYILLFLLIYAAIQTLLKPLPFSYKLLLILFIVTNVFKEQLNLIREKIFAFILNRRIDQTFAHHGRLRLHFFKQLENRREQNGHYSFIDHTERFIMNLPTH